MFQRPRRFWWAPAALAATLLSGGLFAFHWNALAPPPAPRSQRLAPPFPTKTPAPAVSGGPCEGAMLDPNVPHEVHQLGNASVQQSFDCFSWQSLVALNWPAGEKRGEPDAAKAFGELGADGRVVWTTFKQPHQIFLDQGQNPCACDPKTPGCLDTCWSSEATAPPICPSGTAAGSPLLQATSKVGTVADGNVQAVPNVWLTDQSGQLVRYEIRIDRDSFDYIVGNGFFNGATQDALPAAFNFPTGADGGPLGAIEIKAAWKVLGAKDDAKRFFIEDATIVDTRVDIATGRPDKHGVYPTCNLPGEGPCCQRKMGLVGFHIAHKVKGRPQWVWSTFEQVDNAPIQGASPDPKAHYSFNDPACTSCVENANPQRTGAPMTMPVQVARATRIDIPLLPKDVNDQWHALVHDTVWENYVLVSTQWPADPLAVNGDHQPTPEVLSNTTLETYIQSGKKDTASCLTCHSFASGLNGCPGDFSFLLGKAQPRPKTHERSCGGAP
jgi:hypothetical protein